MKTKRKLALPACAAVALALAGLSSLGQAQTTNILRVYTAIEVEHPTEVGKSYTLLGAVSLTNWTAIGNPVLGHGRTVRRIFSTKDAGTVSYASYRLRIEDGPTNGYAPWSLGGIRVQMDDSSSSNVVQYASDDSGHDVYGGGDDAFSYQYSRLGENEAQVDRTYTADRHELLTYSYAGPGVGTWVREEYRLGLLNRRELGTFRYLSYGTNAPVGGTNLPPSQLVVQPPAPPNSLTGLVYYVRSGVLPDEFSFSTLTTGYESASSSTGGRHADSATTGNLFTYSYSVLSSNKASLTVNFGYYGYGGDRQEFDLTYTDGPSGLFSRRIYRLGSLSTTDTGAFSPYAFVSTQTNGTPVTSTNPPANPAGLTFVMVNGPVPPRLVFNNSTSGIEYDDSAPTDFTYTYQSTAPGKYSLVVRFKADRWDEYDLTFSNGAVGSFTRRQFRNNALNRSDAGTFNVTVTGS